MTLPITDLTTLDPDKVEQNHLLIRQLVQEYNPTLSAQRGPVDDILLHVGGILETKSQTEVETSERSRSLFEINQDPTLADDTVVDSVISTFGMTRNAGTKATGQVTIVVSKLASVTISNGARMSANGQTFTSNAAYTARTSSDLAVGINDRVLSPLGDGTYAFVISVTAISVGQEARLTKGTLIDLANPTTNFVQAYATSDFTGGNDDETNAELMARQPEGLTSKVMAGRIAMLATLRNNSEFADVVSSSIVGMGNAEMLRDKTHSIFQIGFGGRVDWYLRMQEQPQLVGITLTATLIEKTSDNRGIWQFNIERNTAPGFYDVVSIQPSSNLFTGTYDVITDTRGFDVTPDDSLPEFFPDMINALEATYTRFQTAVITFKDTDTATSSLTVNTSTQDYPVTVRMFPLIDAIQDWVSGDGIHHGAGDVLIKAPVPCTVELSFSVQRPVTSAVADFDAIKTALAQRVNRYGFSGRLPASVLTDVVHNSLDSSMSVSAIQMVGTIRCPDGSVRRLASTEVLNIPYEPDIMTTTKTVAFIVQPSDIAIADEILE